MSFKVEPGIYWIGDPCYILNDSRYETLIGSVQNLDLKTEVSL